MFQQWKRSIREYTTYVTWGVVAGLASRRPEFVNNALVAGKELAAFPPLSEGWWRLVIERSPARCGDCGSLHLRRPDGLFDVPPPLRSV